jgi:hypothetical protein
MDDMQARDRKIRSFVYSHFIDLQRPPAVSEIAAHLGLSRDRIIEGLHRLHAGRILVLESGKSEIRMAMPFSAVDTGIRVTAAAKSWWANCAWDALGIPIMLKTDARIAASCPDCNEPLRLEVRGGAVHGNAEGIRFEVAPEHFWDNIVYT